MHRLAVLTSQGLNFYLARECLTVDGSIHAAHLKCNGLTLNRDGARERRCVVLKLRRGVHRCAIRQLGGRFTVADGPFEYEMLSALSAEVRGPLDLVHSACARHSGRINRWRRHSAEVTLGAIDNPCPG